MHLERNLYKNLCNKKKVAHYILKRISMYLLSVHKILYKVYWVLGPTCIISSLLCVNVGNRVLGVGYEILIFFTP